MKNWPALALLVAAGLGAGYLDSTTPAQSESRLRELERLRDELQARLETSVASDPIAVRALADPGQIVIVVKAGVIEDLTARVASQYLQEVGLDLQGLEAHAGGKLRKRTFIGRKKVGEWAVAIVINKLFGRLRAGSPRLTFAGNVLDVELPLEVQPATGQISLHFAWESASVVNLVCKDFEVDLEVEGRALRQDHVLRGQIELAAAADVLTATPVVHERAFPLSIELTPASWDKVEAVLRSQDTAGRCGMFLDPEAVLQRLHELVAKGIAVQLPRSILRPVRLPARFEQTVKVNDRQVQLSLLGERMSSSGSLLWSSTRVVVASAQPGATPQVSRSERPLGKGRRGPAPAVIRRPTSRPAPAASRDFSPAASR